MKMKWLGNLFLIAGLAFVIGACQPEPAPPKTEPTANTPAEPPAKNKVTGVLARTRLDEALAAGKKWKADAVLIQVGASGIGDDGTHPMWDYGFYSPASKACALINVAGGQSQVREAGSECEKNEIKDFMDSDKAIMVARTNGVTQPKVKMVVSTSPKGMKVAWNVMDGGGMKQGDVIIEFDAKSSELLSKMVQR